MLVFLLFKIQLDVTFIVNLRKWLQGRRHSKAKTYHGPFLSHKQNEIRQTLLLYDSNIVTLT